MVQWKINLAYFHFIFFDKWDTSVTDLEMRMNYTSLTGYAHLSYWLGTF